MTKGRVALLALLAAAIVAFFALDLGRYLSLDFFRVQQSAIDAYAQRSPVRAGVVFFLIYVAVTGLSLPGAAVMTLIAGAAFWLMLQPMEASCSAGTDSPANPASIAARRSLPVTGVSLRGRLESN